MYKGRFLLLYFASACCIAQQVPSNSLQVEYQKRISVKSTDYFGIESISQVPKATYQYLNRIFNTFYRSFNFNTSITDSTFVDNSYYQLFALPILAPDQHGFEVEVFGNFYDPFTQNLSNFSSDQAMSGYFSNSIEMNLYDCDLAVGAGFSYKTDTSSKFKVIFSNANMPGYGGSTALFGYEKSF